jgi:hypothetical protein
MRRINSGGSSLSFTSEYFVSPDISTCLENLKYAKMLPDVLQVHKTCLSHCGNNKDKMIGKIVLWRILVLNRKEVSGN